MTSQYDEPTETDIAIIGMSGRFPGADSPDELWKKIAAGEELITFFSDEELLNSGVEKAALREASYVNASPVLKDPSRFDALFFGYSPREAQIMDPQQRLFLECAWAALERAGYDPDRYEGPIGVFASEAMNTYLLQSAMTNRFFEEYLPTLLTNDKDFLATRVSYKLNLTGPSMTIQTACSSSLVCVHTACQSLLSEECDMALAGGVSVRVPHVTGYLHQPGSVFSPDGHCRPFDAKAQGTIFGSGAGVVVLKRLTDAIADRDTVWAVIKGSAINNDGASKSDYTAPSVRQQARCVIEAQAIAGVDPETISYIEAHGTGTYLGDPIEVAALSMAFREGTAKNQFCALGSLKSNIGHLDAAAGVAGLIKTAYALKHRTIPPSINFDTPNPEIDFQSSPFRVADRLEAWDSPAGPRRAGVQSLGMGGTNAHVVLEEAPPMTASAHPDRPRFYRVCAKTEEACQEAAVNLANALEADPTLDLGDVAFTLDEGRKSFPFRRAVAAHDRDELIERLRGSAKPVRVDADAPRPGFMFSGQGAQYAGMGRGLYETEAVFRDAVDQCLAAFARHVDTDLSHLIFPAAGEETAAAEKLRQTIYTQPALFTIEYALARLWMSWGVEPQWMIGHSIGEYVAATLAGVFNLDAATEIVATRARLMHGCEPGAMLAVSRSADETRALLNDDLDIAVINTSSSTVVSGPIDAIEALAQRLAGERIPATRLQTSHAFHSQMMAPILEEFERVVARHTLAPPTIPFISNISGDWITDEEATSPRYWADHIRKPVRFADGLTTLFDEGKKAFIEAGPGRTLTAFVGQHPAATVTTPVFSSLPHPRQEADDRAFIREAAANLWATGIELDDELIARPETGRRVPLPTYPFARTGHWIDQTQLPVAPTETRRNTADWVYQPVWQKTDLPGSKPAPGDGSWLILSDALGVGEELARRLSAAGQTVTIVDIGQEFERLSKDRFRLAPADVHEYQRLLAALSLEGRSPDHVVHLWMLTGQRPHTGAAERLEGARQNGMYALMALAQAQAATQKPTTAGWRLTVVSDGIHAIGDTPAYAPEKAAALGITKAIPVEFRDTSCVSLDLDLAVGAVDAVAVADTIEPVLHGPTDVEILALRDGTVFTPDVELVATGSPEAGAAKLRDQGVYIIFGGLGGIARELARYLARKHRARLVLVGRSAMPPREIWSEWLANNEEGEATTDRILALQELERLGADVLTISADLSNRTELKKVVETTLDRYGAIHGVIHSAAVIDHAGPLARRSRDAHEAAVRSKMQGLVILEEVLDGVELDFLVVNASIASELYRNFYGQAGYITANTFADAFVSARACDATGPTRIVIDWDGWDAGMLKAASPAFVANLDSQERIAPSEGIELFLRILAKPRARFLVSIEDLAARLSRDAVKRAPSPVAAALPFGLQQAVPAIPSPAAAATAPPPTSAVPADVTSYLLGHAAAALGYQAGEIDVDQPLVALGLDSLRAVTLRSDILMDLGVDVAIEDLVGDCTITSLASRLEADGAQLTPTLEATAAPIEPAVPDAAVPAPAVADAAATPDTAAPAAEIEGYLRSQVADVLGYAPDQIATDQPLVALGLDSLRAVSIQSNIATHLDVMITVEDLLGDGTIASLTTLLTARLNASPGAPPDENGPQELDMVEGEI